MYRGDGEISEETLDEAEHPLTRPMNGRFLLVQETVLSFSKGLVSLSGPCPAVH